MTGSTAYINNAALFAIIASLADNKQAIGRRYAYWCNGAPALEAAVAAAAMTQDELGHARTLYPLLSNFVQAALDPLQVEPETRTLHYSLAFLDKDFESWTDFIATNFLLDTALTTFFASAQNSLYEPLRQRARKIIQEEQLHSVHGNSWVRRLAHTGGTVRAVLTRSLEYLWNETLCWFGPADDPPIQQLYKEGIIDATSDELRARYLQNIMPTLNEVDLEFPVTFHTDTKRWQPAQPLPWSNWDAQARRFQECA